jgi:DNA (cytosine-5)-methyltransferase 1
MQSNGEWKENDEQRRRQSQSEHWENGINGNVAHSTSNLRFIKQKNDTPRTQEWEFPNTFNEFGKQRNAPNSDNGCGSCDTVQTRREEFKELYDSQQDAPNSDLHGFHERNGNDEINASERGFNALNDIDQSNGIGNIADSKGERLEGLRRQKERHSKLHRGYDGLSNWQNFPTESPVCGGDDGISYGLDNITFPKWRNESIKGYGNAVVPQVVYRIFKTIEYIENLKQ